ncbi:MAG: helix-turn-helix transcriptional regulator [Acidobacteria bacterium]|nr:helix-turn-helix transcriptional regulator [Acidobacteriota bacterium]
MEEVLSALDDPTRRALLDQLAERGSATATVLSSQLPITRQAVVQHLTVLTKAGLVSGERRGRERWFAVHTEKITETARWLEDLATKWDRRLDTIKQIAEKE